MKPPLATIKGNVFPLLIGAMAGTVIRLVDTFLRRISLQYTKQIMIISRDDDKLKKKSAEKMPDDSRNVQR